MGASGSMSENNDTTKSNDDTKRLVEIFQNAVYKAARIQVDDETWESDGEHGDTNADKLRRFFDEADLNQDGQLDQFEMEHIIERINIDIAEEDKEAIRNNMKHVLLSLNQKGVHLFFDQFVAALKQSETPQYRRTLVSDAPKRIVFVGATGTGKSALCTALTGQDKNNTTFKIGNSSSSETTVCSSDLHHWFGNPNEEKFMCIDTPGLDDEKGRDDEFINNIIDKLRCVEYINAIVMVVNGQNPRFSTSLQHMIKRFEQAFTSKFYEHSIICLTRWYMDPDSIEEREEDGRSEQQIAAELNEKLRASKSLVCKQDMQIPVLFVDSLYQRKDPKHGKDRLAVMTGIVSNKVFRTADLAKLRPRVVAVNNSSQTVRNGSLIWTIVPVLFDDSIKVIRWEVSPALPAGLSMVDVRRGWISGTPTSCHPKAIYYLSAVSAGGVSDGYPLEIEITQSEREEKEIVAATMKLISEEMDKLLPIEDDRPLNESEAAEAIHIAKMSSIDLFQRRLASLGVIYGMYSTFPNLKKLLRAEYERRFLQMEQDFLISKKRALADASERSKCEKDLEIFLIRKSTRVEHLLLVLERAKLLAADQSLVSRAEQWLSMIKSESCCHSIHGCIYSTMKKDLESHETYCIFGMPLYGKDSIVTSDKADTSRGIVVTCSRDPSWSGKYTWDNADQEFYLFNRQEKRLQKIFSRVRTEGEVSIWEVAFRAKDDELDTVIASSANSVASVLDARLEGFSIVCGGIYAWSVERMMKPPSSKSVKLFYFGGKWCQYCPRYVAIVVRFFNSVRKQCGNDALDIVFVSSDNNEQEMLEYFMEEHGDWRITPSIDYDYSTVLSQKYNVRSVPFCVLVNNNMEAVSETAYLGGKGVRDFLKDLPVSESAAGPQLDTAAWTIFQSFKLAVDKSQGIQINDSTVLSSSAAVSSSSLRSNEAFDVFCSLRYSEAESQALQVVEALKVRSINATIIQIPEGDDIAAAVSTRLDQAKLVVIFGSTTYGTGTSSSFSTREELQFIMDENKPFFLIKMCDRFSEARTRLVLSRAISYKEWMPGTAMPADLVDSIASKLRSITHMQANKGK